jgi:uncharacterized membrane protein
VAGMDLTLALKFLHVIGAAILFGTGLGIAFFLFRAGRKEEPVAIAATLRTVVVADYLFTATAAVLQPVTGLMLMRRGGYGLDQTWILASLALYVLWACVGFPWWRSRSRCAILPRGRWRPKRGHCRPATIFSRASGSGWAGRPFLSTLGIFWLMLAKPVLCCTQEQERGPPVRVSRAFEIRALSCCDSA